MVPKVSDIIGIIDKIAPFSFAEEWDNVGLQVGSATAVASRIMVALDAGKEAINAACAAGCQLLLTHHPLLFRPVKRLHLADPLGELLCKAIKSDLSIVSLHTNYDIADGGVNDLLAERIGIGPCSPLRVSGQEELVKLCVFVPKGHEEKVLEALFRFSGFIGNYRDCSFRSTGVGTYTPLAGSRPFLGEPGKRETVEETKLEVLLRKEDLSDAVQAMVQAHPYEEPAFDLYPLFNSGISRGLGRVGDLPRQVSLAEFAESLKESFNVPGARYVGDGQRLIKKVAVCGGSGASLLGEAVRHGADVLVTGDVKYHDAREAQALGLALIDLGHYATEALFVRGMAARLREKLAEYGYSAEIQVCEGETDPFSFL